MTCWIFDSRIHHLIHHFLTFCRILTWADITGQNLPTFPKGCSQFVPRWANSSRVGVGFWGGFQLEHHLPTLEENPNSPVTRFSIKDHRPQAKFNLSGSENEFYVTKPDIPPNSPNFSHPPPCQIQVSDGTSINMKPKGWSLPSHPFLDIAGPPLVGGEPSLPRFSQVNDEDHGSTPCGGSAALCLHATVHGPPADRIGGRHRGEARGRGKSSKLWNFCGHVSLPEGRKCFCRW